MAVTEHSTAPEAAERVPRRLVAAVALGTLLNPLNSSMIAVALIRLRADFGVSIAAATWLVSGFYLAGAVGQPLMGRLADQFGPRRIFCSGLLLVGVTAALTPWAPAFGWLVALRVLQAFGTSAAYPAAMAILRTWAQERAGGDVVVTRPPAAALGVLSIVANVSAALGPTLGGFLVVAAGWPAIFLVNVPFAVLGIAMALRWLPADRRDWLPAGNAPDSPGTASERARRRSAQNLRSRMGTLLTVLHMVDLPGILLFSGTLVSLLAFLLSLPHGPQWPLLPVVPIAAVLLYLREQRTAEPFLNVRMLRVNRRLVGVYAQFAALNVVFYTLFFGLPLWLEQVRRFDPGQAGLIMLPFAGLGVVATYAAVRLIRRSGTRLTLVVGALVLTVGTLLLLLFGATTPLAAIVLMIAVLGIPNGFQGLGLQTALYDAAPPQEMGAAAGQFQTFRYLGSILSTSLLGLIFGGTVTSAGLHVIAVALTAISLLLLAVAFKG